MKAFVDTNVLVYAYDRAAGTKRDLARNLVESLWNEGRGVLSTQVLQEFYVNVRPQGATTPSRRKKPVHWLPTIWSGDPIVNDGATVLEAVDLGHRYRLSFWDALVVVASRKGGASVLYSEDLNHGQRFGSVQVLNPFLESEP